MTLVIRPQNGLSTEDLLLQQCSADHQHTVLTAKKNQERLGNLTRFAITGIALSFVIVQPLNSVGEWTWRFLKAPNFDPTGMQTNFSELNVDKGFNATLKEGDNILGYPITSAFGDRIHPVTGEKKKHEGIDIATPENTPIYAFGRPRDWSLSKMFDDEIIYTDCKEDPVSGKYAIVTSSLMKDYKFYLMHLNSCDAGTSASGAIIANTGNTGRSTAPHLHFGVELKGQMIDPPKGFVVWALQGKPMQSQSNKPIVERLRNAIAGQESNHNPSAVNPHSNALGYGQVMPENIKEWSTQCLGKPLTEDEFIKSKDKQVKIIDCKLTEYLKETATSSTNEDEQIRKVASMWYSGDASLYDNPRPQTYGSGDYPSIQNYTKTVLERFKKQ